MPDCVFAQPEEQRSPRCNEDFADLDDRRFVRALLPVPIEGGEEFRFGIWVEVSVTTFERVVRAWNESEAYRTLSFDGAIANAFPPLGERATGVRVKLATRDERSRPFVVHADDAAVARLLWKGWTQAEHLALADVLRA